MTDLRRGHVAALPAPAGSAGTSVWRPYDPVHTRLLVTTDPTVTAQLRRTDGALGAVTDYVAEAGVTVDGLLTHLGPYLDDGTVALEPVGDELFIHTAPHGRPAPPRCADVPPNMWERLRDRHTPEGAAALWQLARTLQWAGWKVQCDPARIAYATSPLLGVALGLQTATTGLYGALPLLTPTPSRPQDGTCFTAANAHLLAEPTGPLGTAAAVGIGKVVVVADGTDLDVVTTQVRRWLLAQPHRPDLVVYVLDTPRCDPVVLTAADPTAQPAAAQLT